MVTDVLPDHGAMLRRCKSLFVLMYLDPRWIDQRSLVAVNGMNQISLDYGPWHGEALFESNWVFGPRWTMEFLTPMSGETMTMHRFLTIWGTFAFSNQEEGRNAQYNSILLPCPDYLIPKWEVERERHDTFHRRQQEAGFVPLGFS